MYLYAWKLTFLKSSYIYIINNICNLISENHSKSHIPGFREIQI